MTLIIHATKPIQTINGYLFNPNFSMGLGIGVDVYKDISFVPIFMDFRVNFLKSNITPFFSTDIGYSFFAFERATWDNYGYNSQGGLLINPAIGIKFFITPKSALNFSIGYRIQKNTYIPIQNEYSNTPITESAESMNLKVGMTF